ncbi:hypothetical protein JYY74_004232 [Salmonella enterica subsp. enterica serovar Enteritidis]|nr:hypothetical protein [Salmonella enterica subsp. enterica serovar Enteritidis]
MTGNIMRITIYVLSWCAWTFRNLVIFPAGMLTLIVVLLMVREHTSPGKILVNITQNADSVTDGVNWTWRECPTTTSSSKSSSPKMPVQPSVLSAKCPEVKSDAKGYAAHIDRNLLPLVKMLWVILAAISAAIELGLRRRFPVLKHSTRPQIRTITSREQLLVNGKVRERVATHIVTGAHGYETLCTSGYNISYNDKRVLIENCEKLAEGAMPVTCSTCFIIWKDIHAYQPSDFDTESGKGKFTATDLTEITIPR